MKDIQMFNVRYRDDLYGVKSVIKNNVCSCIMIKYQVGSAVYQNVLKGAIEYKLANDEDFRNEFLRGFIVHFNISQEVVSMPSTETRVRMGAKQTAKGSIQLDITAEAPTVEEAGDLLGKAIDRLKKEVSAKGLKTADQD